MWALLWVACSGERQEPDPCSGPGAPTWDNFAQGYVRTWCLGCHSASLPPGARQGAPVGVDFDRWSQVHAWRDAISLSATGPEADMPPMGGVPDDAVARFERWLSCGAEGRDAPPGPCDRLAPVGDRAVASQADADALCEEGNATGALSVSGSASIDCLCAVQGALRVSEGDLELPLLERVDGDLTLQGSLALRAPELRHVGGSVSLSGPVREVTVPSLTTVGGDLWLSESGALVELSLDGLYTVGGAMVLRRARLARLYVPRLKEVGGDLLLEDLPELVALDGTRSMKAIGGSLILRRMARLPVLDDWAFLFLEQVGQDVLVQDNAQLLAIHGLTLLSSVPGDLAVEDNPSLVRIEGLDQLLVVQGDLRLARNPQQQSLRGMINLERVEGALVFEDLPRMSSLVGLEALAQVGDLRLQGTDLAQLSELPLLSTVDGALEIAGNAALASVQEWEALRRVEGAVEIRDNPLLPTSAVELWLAGLDHVGGPVTLSGNGAQ